MSTTATYPAGIFPLGYQQLTVSDTVLGLTVPKGAMRAAIGVEAQPIRYRVDGKYPTDTVGFLVKADVVFELDGIDTLKAFRVIKDGTTDAVLNVHYYGELGQIIYETTTTTTAETTSTTTTE